MTVQAKARVYRGKYPHRIESAWVHTGNDDSGHGGKLIARMNNGRMYTVETNKAKMKSPHDIVGKEFQDLGADFRASFWKQSDKLTAANMKTAFSARVEVSAEKIANAIIGAFEGGSTYWVQSGIHAGGPTLDSPYYAAPEFYLAPDMAIAFRYDDPNKDEGNGKGRKTITRADLQSGLDIMAQKYGSHFADLVNENDDASTHDVFLQCVILGDVIYG